MLEKLFIIYKIASRSLKVKNDVEEKKKYGLTVTVGNEKLFFSMK